MDVFARTFDHDNFIPAFEFPFFSFFFCARAMEFPNRNRESFKKYRYQTWWSHKRFENPTKDVGKNTSNSCPSILSTDNFVEYILELGLILSIERNDGLGK